MINSYSGCPEQDSNLHASQHSHLKRARLPFRHLGFCVCKGSGFFQISKTLYAKTIQRNKNFTEKRVAGLENFSAENK